EAASDERALVLIVEDNPASARLLQDTLSSAGYDVALAETVDEALTVTGPRSPAPPDPRDRRRPDGVRTPRLDTRARRLPGHRVRERPSRHRSRAARAARPGGRRPHPAGHLGLPGHRAPPRRCSDARCADHPPDRG